MKGVSDGAFRRAAGLSRQGIIAEVAAFCARALASEGKGVVARPVIYLRRGARLP